MHNKVWIVGCLISKGGDNACAEMVWGRFMEKEGHDMGKKNFVRKWKKSGIFQEEKSHDRSTKEWDFMAGNRSVD